MFTLPNTVLSQILSHSSFDDRLISSKFYHLTARPFVSRLSRIDLPYLLTRSSKIPTFSWPKITIAQQLDVVSDIFSYLIDLNGPRIRSVRFASDPPLQPEILQLLSDGCPNIDTLDFSAILQSPLQSMETLPLFRNLRHLRLPKQIGQEFAPILAQLRLRTLEIGGENAPLVTADNRELRRLIISGVPPRVYVDNVHCLADWFPNLVTHDMEKGRDNGWRWRIHVQFKNQGEAAADNYRRLTNLRRSRFIDDDPYLFPRTDDLTSFSHFFPNLRRLVISLRDYNEENGDIHPPPWTRTVAVLSHLPHLTELRIEGRNDYGPSAAFGELVSHGLELAGHVRKLELQGRFPAWDRSNIDQNFGTIACGKHLRSLTLCGTNVAGILEKLLETSPRLREIDYTDELLALFGVDESASRFSSSLAKYSKSLKGKNRVRRLRLRQTVLGVYIANRVRDSDNFMNHQAMIDLGNAGWPELEELDVRIEDDPVDPPLTDPKKPSAVAAFFSQMPKLKKLKLELDAADGYRYAPMPQILLDNAEIARPGGSLKKILHQLPLLDELHMNETKIDINITDWKTIFSCKNLKKFTCRLNTDSQRYLDEGLRDALELRRRVIEKEGYQLPLLKAFIFDCPMGARRLPLVGDGDALIDSRSRLRVIIPSSTGGGN